MLPVQGIYGDGTYTYRSTWYGTMYIPGKVLGLRYMVMVSIFTVWYVATW